MKTTKNQKTDIKKPPVLFDETQHIISQLQEKIGSRVLTYWNSHHGSICANDLVALFDILQRLGGNGERINIFLKSDGGDGESSLRIVNLIRQYFNYIVMLTPLECASAATMIALGADEILMGPLAYLTAIDTSLTHDLSPLDRDNRRVSVSQDELTRIISVWEQKSKEHHPNPYSDIFQYIHPLVVGAIDRASSLSIRICKEILLYHIQEEDRAESISKHLNSDYPSHSYPITWREAKRLGLNVHELEPEINTLLLSLNELYSEMAQRAVTDFDEYKHHNNEILNILEGEQIQIYFQNDKDWHYLKEERRWITLNDESSWHKVELVHGKQEFSTIHIR